MDKFSDHFTAKVAKTIGKNRMIEPGEGVVVGVSGGADSVVLLHLLSKWREDWHLKVLAAHVNHGLRGAESDRDEAFVRKTSAEWQIPFEAIKVDIKRSKKQWHLSTQEAARKARYGFFEELARRHRFQKIALAHHGDDQVESVLMSLIRGSGSRGLKGIPCKRNRGIIRPLMEVRKDEILKYLRANDLEYVEDRTNREFSYLRNKIRGILIPLLKQWNPKIEEGMMRFALLQKRDEDFFSQTVEEAFQKSLLFEKDGEIGCDLNRLSSMHPSIRGRLIRYCLERINPLGLWGITFSHIEAIHDLLEKGATGSQIHLPRNIVIERSYHQLIFKAGKVEQISEFCYRVSIPGEVIIPEAGLRIGFDLLEQSGSSDSIRSEKTALLDADLVPSPLCLRSARPGDRFRPLGLDGTKKLKDFFIDEKIPRDKRKRIPILEGNGEILWVVGWRIDERFKIKRSTKQVLRAKIKEA